MARAITFWLLAAIILVSPAYAGLLQRRDRTWIPRWIMFSGMGLNFYDVRFERELNGRRVPLDPYAWLGYASSVEVPQGLRRLTSVSAAQHLARLVCHKRSGSEAIYMHLRDATREGWNVIDDGSTDVCAPRPRVPRAKGR